MLKSGGKIMEFPGSKRDIDSDIFFLEVLSRRSRGYKTHSAQELKRQEFIEQLTLPGWCVPMQKGEFEREDDHNTKL